MEEAKAEVALQPLALQTSVLLAHQVGYCKGWSLPTPPAFGSFLSLQNLKQQDFADKRRAQQPFPMGWRCCALPQHSLA